VENWSGVSRAYRASFARLCAGTIDEVLSELAGERLLDVGCGTGDLLAEAIERGWAAEGVDPDPDMVAMSEAVAPGCVRQAALPELPYDDGTFDAVTANFVVNHVPDPRAAMRELARVIAPRGRLAVTIWPAGGAGWSGLVAGAFADAGAVPLPSTRLPEQVDFRAPGRVWPASPTRRD
jgi:ubiquinone/menaquinone biosynthesis C-methylase UbiE